MGISEGMAMGTTTPILLKVPPSTGSPPPRASLPEQELDAHQGLVLPQVPPQHCRREQKSRGWSGGGGAHSVLEAKLVSSCLSLPSSASPRFSRLLARKGVKV